MKGATSLDLRFLLTTMVQVITVVRLQVIRAVMVWKLRTGMPVMLQARASAQVNACLNFQPRRSLPSAILDQEEYIAN